MVGGLSIEWSATDCFAALPGAVSPLKRAVSQHRKTVIHTVRTDPEAREAVGT